MRLRSLREIDWTDETVVMQQADTNASILVPFPSSLDPNDPLRWPTHKKNIAFVSVCAFTFLTNYAIAGLAPAFYVLSKQFDKSMTETSQLLLYPVLVLGAFNFFWVPMANYFGKRPVFVFSSGLLCACYVWGATAQSFKSLLWSNITAAFAGSATEALGASIVNDLFFLHERGAKMGIYMNSIAGGNTIGPLVCGFIVSNLSWRWHKWIAAILVGINFLCVVFFVPETRYDRTEKTEKGHTSRSNSQDKTAPPDVTSVRRMSDDSVPTQMPQKTFAQDLKLWSGTPETNLFKMFLRPFPMIAYPAVMYSFLTYSVSLVVVIAVNILNPFVLQKPPYSWKPEINGLINIPGLVGNVFGAWAGGNLADMWCKHRTKIGNGIYDPESRLHILITPFLLTTGGCILFGYGVDETLGWVSLFFGYGMISVALTAIPTVTLAYVSDCALAVNSDAFLLVSGLKNIVAFGFLFGIIPWAEEAGFVEIFGTMAGVFVGVVGVGAVLLIAFGARVRHASNSWKIILE
ncbi:hypothetical protein HBH64_018070 [Parastagonospora nodorum]|nr:hypothetical protein HBH52_033830 [Parastagonospora nodorum]KAH4073116.1 hypothetical protein HBH50_049910 [Parastagonospora nodorum]KAH4099828.1 hypothetical protein HBH48_012250 [Parastagonospora nodorum]KAH4111125.1 hypothetical protein HBH46_012010 [Parastagonospora nodorum]KAH4298884.1 hypothetical protein HBI01_127170 [Parastagonospora nodorum]